MLVRKRPVPARIGVDLGAVQRHRAHLQHPHLTPQHQHLDEQFRDLLQKPPPKRRDRVVVRMVIGRNEAKRYRIVGGALQLPARKHSCRVTVNQQPQQHRRMVRCRTRAAIAADQCSQVQPINHFNHKPRQMPLRQPLIHRRGQQKPGLPIHVAKIAHPPPPLVPKPFHFTTLCASDPKSDRLLGRPISRSLTACCVGLELRPLPSTGITRLPQYYEPLRHPSAPGLSLTGVRLIIPDHALGFPVLRALSLCTWLPPLPRCSSWVYSSLVSPSRISLPRFHCRVGLHIVLFEVCSAFTHIAACTLAQSPYFVDRYPGLQTFRHLHACPGGFRLERSPGGPCTHWKSAALSRLTWKAVIRSPDTIG